MGPIDMSQVDELIELRGGDVSWVPGTQRAVSRSNERIREILSRFESRRSPS